MRPLVLCPAVLVTLLVPAAAFAAPPSVTFTAPREADEGSPITVTATVSDPEGATPTWSWDLDGDGTYGEQVDAATVTVPSGTTDGDSDLTIGVQASDGTETQTASVSIGIVNVAPTITSVPGVEASVRREYAYDAVVSDPGGARDAIAIRLTARPAGMLIDGAHVTWTPEPDQRGRTFPVILRLDDGDGGEAAQMWSIVVANNTAPSSPTPTTPIERARVSGAGPVTLTVENAEDLDEDPLVYVFELSQTSSFEGADVIVSGDVREGTDGATSWTTDAALTTGLWYWRVRASDGLEESPVRFAQLVVEGVDATPDAGASDAGTEVEPDGGCAVSSRRGGPGPWGGAALLSLIALGRRRRAA